MARIGIDARFYGTIGKGLGRYTQKLIEHLERIDTHNQYVIFLRKENFEEYQPLNPNFSKVLADYHWYSFEEQISFPRLLNRYSLDLVHFPHFNVPLLYRKKFIITIHDLILLHFPTLRCTTLNPLWYRIKFLAYRLAIFSCVHRATSIMTVSEFTKKDILGHYRVPAGKVVVAHEACEDFCRISREDDDEILKKYGIIKPYILYVGNAYPHKNLERLVCSLAHMRKDVNGLKLVLVGKHDYFYRALERFVGQRAIKDVVFPGFIPDMQLDVVYKNAALYVFPSLYEGFGLPPLEAMALGVPVVTSDHECMREILGDSALFVDAKREEAIANGVLRLLRDAGLRAEMVRRGYQCIRKYSWKKMAQQTQHEYIKNIRKK